MIIFEEVCGYYTFDISFKKIKTYKQMFLDSPKVMLCLVCILPPQRTNQQLSPFYILTTLFPLPNYPPRLDQHIAELLIILINQL